MTEGISARVALPRGRKVRCSPCSLVYFTIGDIAGPPLPADTRSRATTSPWAKTARSMKDSVSYTRKAAITLNARPMTRKKRATFLSRATYSLRMFVILNVSVHVSIHARTPVSRWQAILVDGADAQRRGTKESHGRRRRGRRRQRCLPLATGELHVLQ